MSAVHAAELDPALLDPLHGLSFMQQIALIRMLNADARGISRQIMAAEHCQDSPSGSDYRVLTELGLAQQEEDGPYHELTMAGRPRAADVLTALCEQHGIHVLLSRMDERTTYFRCSCGHWRRQITGKGRHALTTALSLFGSHANPVDVDTWREQTGRQWGKPKVEAT